jgi:virginiamycin B lyase
VVAIAAGLCAASAVRASPAGTEAAAKKRCRIVTKTVRGKKHHVRVCTTVKPKPKPKPKPPAPALPAAGRVTASIAVANAVSLAAGEGSVWVSSNDSQLVRIDPATNAVVATIPLPPGIVAVGAGSVWVSDFDRNQVNRIDPATNTVVATIHVGAAPEGIAFSPGAVWVANHHDGTVSRIDPTTDTVVATVVIPDQIETDGPQGIAASADAVWVAASGSAAVYRIDPATNTVVSKIPETAPCGSVILAAGSVWVAEGGCRTRVTRIDPATDRPVATILVGHNDVSAALGGVWITDFDKGDLLRVDPATNRIAARSHVGNIATAAVGLDGSLWTATTNAVVRIEPTNVTTTRRLPGQTLS